MALTVFQQKPLKHFVTISEVSWLSCLIFHFLLVFFPWSWNLAKLSPSLKKNLNLNVLIIAQYCYFLILTKLLKEPCLISNSVNYNLHLDFDKNTSHALIHLTDKIRQTTTWETLAVEYLLTFKKYLIQFIMISLFKNWLIMV